MPDVWSWRFSSADELRQALEEYTAFQEGTSIRRYGIEGLRVKVDDRGNDILDAAGNPVLIPDREPIRNKESGAQAEMNKARIRSEIDRCMDLLRRRYPHWYRLVDAYYRQGASIEPRGWIAVADAFGCHKSNCPALVRCPVSPGDNRPGVDECRRHHKNHCHWNYDTFGRQLSCAIDRLYDVHRMRHKSGSLSTTRV